jgi:hypothetical protein
MKFSFLCLFLFLACFYPMKEEFEKFEFNLSEIDFLYFLKENYSDENFSEVVISLVDSQKNEAQAVIQFFNPYIKVFQSHQYCSRKCVGEIKNDERDDYVILSSSKEDKFPLECYSQVLPIGKKELFFPFEEDRICDSIKYRKETKFFPVPKRDKDGQHLTYQDGKGNIINLYEENEYQEKKCYIVDSESKKVDHSKCKKEKCKNEDINEDYEQYDKTQPCALINEAKTLGNKCCWIIDNAELYLLRLFDLPFFSAIKTIEDVGHQEKNIIQINISKIKELGMFDKILEKKSFNFFVKKFLKPQFLNKKNIGFGSLMGCLAYWCSSPQVKKRNALVGGLTAYGGACLAFAYIYRAKKKLIFDQKSLKKKTELY